jgi:hypothetical protein
MRASLVVAVASLALACGSKKEKKPEPAAKGSGATTAVETGSAAPGSAAAGSGSADSACSDDDIKKHIEAGLNESVAYLGALERRVVRWKKDCESAMQDLLALEPNATRFMDAMMTFRTWGETLTPECRKRIEEIGEQHAITKDVEARTPAIEAGVKPMLERCKDHPGFQEAAAKGLRVMRRKAPPQ